MEYTIVTGACGGLGGAFVRELAKRGEPMLLLGRDVSRLAELRVKLCAEYGIEPRIYELDLTDEKARGRFCEYLAEYIRGEGNGLIP